VNFHQYKRIRHSVTNGYGLKILGGDKESF
jgi:hypothetical protein